MTPSPFPGVTYVKAPERSSVSDNAPVETLVSEIIANVREYGDAAVRDYVLSRDGAEDYLATYHRLLDLTTAGYRREGKRYMTIAVGCTGGKHRSVAMAEALAARLEKAPDLTVNVVHRDLGRE